MVIAATLGTLVAGVVSLAAARRRRARRSAALPIANRYATPAWHHLDRVSRF